MASNTGLSSPGEVEMTRSMSAVAVCCCSDSRSSLSSRTFLNRDDSLIGEAGDQLDLSVCKRSDLLAVDRQGTDQLPFLEHRGHETCPNATELHRLDDSRIVAFKVCPFRGKVGDVNNRFRPSHETKSRRGSGPARGAPACLDEGRRRVMHRRNAKGVPLTKV